MVSQTLHENEQMQFLFQGYPVFRTHFKQHRDSTPTIQDTCHTAYATTHYTQQVQAFLGLAGFYRKFIKGFAKIAKPLMLLTCQQVKFDWTAIHHTTFLNLKEAITQAPILCYPDPNKKYIIYTDASDDACGAQLLQEHDETEFPIAFFCTHLQKHKKMEHNLTGGYGVYYVIAKWNYYLQGANITVKNDHKPLAKFLNGKNANNIVNRWSLELTTYNITFEWISGAKNKAADCLSWLVEQPMTIPATVNMLTVTHTNGPASNTRSCTKWDSPDTTFTPHPNVLPSISPDATQTPKLLTADRLEALL